jgi:hypothetical protein
LDDDDDEQTGIQSFFLLGFGNALTIYIVATIRGYFKESKQPILLITLHKAKWMGMTSCFRPLLAWPHIVTATQAWGG